MGLGGADRGSCRRGTVGDGVQNSLTKFFIRYDTRCYFKADVSQVNLPLGTKNYESGKKESTRNHLAMFSDTEERMWRRARI